MIVNDILVHAPNKSTPTKYLVFHLLIHLLVMRIGTPIILVHLRSRLCSAFRYLASSSSGQALEDRSSCPRGNQPMAPGYLLNVMYQWIEVSVLRLSGQSFEFEVHRFDQNQ
jgi:hypothetical protein